MKMLAELGKFATTAGLKVVVTKEYGCRDTEIGLQIDGLLDDGVSLAVDFSVVDVTSNVAMNSWKSYQDARTPMNKIAKLCSDRFLQRFPNSDLNYKPLAIESTGRWSPGLHKLFKQVIRFGVGSGKFPRHCLSILVANWRQRISTQFMRNMAASSVSISNELMIAASSRETLEVPQLQ